MVETVVATGGFVNARSPAIGRLSAGNPGFDCGTPFRGSITFSVSRLHGKVECLGFVVQLPSMKPWEFAPQRKS